MTERKGSILAGGSGTRHYPATFGTYGSLLDSCNFVRTQEKRQGPQLGCLEEIVFPLGWIGADDLMARAEKFKINDYGRYLMQLTDQ